MALIYLSLFIGSAVYAALLALFKHYWEPNLTWLEVILGVVLCLLAPYLAQRIEPVDVLGYEHRVWLAFVVGGTPIVIWQLGRSVSAWLRVERRLQERDGDATKRAATMAQSRGAYPPDDD